MVCIPCIIAPVLLFIWYRFIQPIVLKFWNPWAPVADSKKPRSKEEDKTSSCPFSSKTEVDSVSSTTDVAEKESSSKKID